VLRIQGALKAAGFTQDEPDGVFGGRTESAVKSFQEASGLAQDGVVGPVTWGRLFPRSAPVQPAASGDVDQRSLGLTGSFETGRIAPNCYAAVTGDFDGQGMSFGALQWNLGQGTLQPLLKRFLVEQPELAADIFGDHLDTLRQAVGDDVASALAFARSIQDARHKLQEPWLTMFTNLGLRKEFQALQLASAADYAARGVRLWQGYGLWSERGRALMFDIAVQNGSIPASVKVLILGDFAAIPASLSPEDMEVAGLGNVLVAPLLAMALR
jgi:hypothetical protein